MLFEDNFLVNAPRQEVWNFLFNTERMARCIPGMKEIKAESDSSYSCKIGVKVGIVSATFQLKITIQEVEMPNRLTSLFIGNDPKIGSSFKAMNTVELLSISPTQTEIRYKSDVNLMGKLGTLGLSVIKAKAVTMMKAFGEAIKKEIEETHPDGKEV